MYLVCILIMVLNPGRLPPPALRLALPRVSSHAAPGGAGTVCPGAVSGAERGSSITQPPAPSSCWPGSLPTPKTRPQKHPLAAPLGEELGVGWWGGCPSAVRTPRRWGPGAVLLNAADLGVRGHRGVVCEPREGVCVFVCVCRGKGD